ncbi:MAG: adenylate/guanylate cyclase domain-containing protein [Acidimicrobiia bacterium]|nr:adenylate/guanylate cyclase domain-containing protein [Acidimicrobiia bacterium]
MSETLVEVVALNADVVGYSRLLADDLEATTATMEEYKDLVEEKVAESGGTLVNFVGDNFMAVFDDAKDAVRTSIAIANEIESKNATRSRTGQTRFRMGMDQGAVTISDGRYFGDALNIAARIQAIAPPGGLSVSGRVYQALDEPALRFKPLGRRRLKNIPEEVDVYEFADLPADGRPSSVQRPLALESPTVAVLPIHAEMVDESVRATAGILRMDLIHRLTRVPSLSVIDAKAELGSTGAPGTARYMVETGIHQAGENVRVYATLIDVTSMNVVKSHRWTTTVAGLFALSEQLADEVARAIEVDLVIGEPAGLYADLGDPEAIEQVYLGWYHLTSGTVEGWSRALDLFGRVADSHPDQPYGHVLSAFANWMGASNGWAREPKEMLLKARDQAQVGLGLGDPTGLARTVEAAVLMSQGRGAEALEAMEKLEIVRPTCDVTFGLEGSVRRYLGQWEKAIDLTDVAMRLTGVNKPWYPTVKACSLFMGGRVEEAASVAEMVLEHQPHNLEALLVLTAAQVELGLDRRARATAELTRERYPAVDIAHWIDANPYQGRDMVDRWKADLVSAGAVELDLGDGAGA